MAKEPLSDKERKFMERILSFPLLFPSEFTGWLPQHIGLVGNIPESAIVTARDAWHTVGDSGEPAFEHSWVNYNAAANMVARFKKKDGFVYLSGFIKSGTIDQSAFTLPAGYWPSARVILTTLSNNAIGRVQVENDGRVVPATPSTNTWVNLDGLFFTTD